MTARITLLFFNLLYYTTLNAQLDVDMHETDNKVKNEPVIHSFSPSPLPEEKLNRYLSKNNYVGYDLLWPRLKKDWSSNDPWVGVNAQLSYFHFGFATGNAQKTDSLGLRNGQGYIFNLGMFYNHPIHIIRNIVTLEPEIGLDVNIGRFRDDPEKDPMAWGLGITPGFGIKVGPAKFVAKYCASFAVNMFDRSNAWSGGMSYPMLSAYFETGWGLMNPKNIQSKGIFTTSVTQKDYLGTEQIGNSFYEVYRYTTSYTDHTVKSSIYDIGPFWYVAPKISSSKIISRDQRNTMQYGLSIGGRVGIIGGDVYASTGTIGFGNALTEDQMKTAYGELRDFTGEQTGTSFGATGGIEFLGLITKMFVHSHEDRSIYSAVRFARIMFMAGYGQTQLSGTPTYNRSTAAMELIAFNTDYPDQAIASTELAGGSTKSNFYSLGLRIEMGLVSVGFDKFTYDQMSIADGYAFTFQYFIPPSRLVRSAKVMRRINQELRQKK